MSKLQCYGCQEYGHYKEIVLNSRRTTRKGKEIAIMVESIVSMVGCIILRDDIILEAYNCSKERTHDIIIEVGKDS